MSENNSKKTISASTIVIIILSIVIVLMLIFGVIFFFMMRSNKDENPTAVSNVNSQVTAENETSKNNVSTNATTTTTQPVSNGNISDDWKDCEFIFNNKTYKLYVPYSDLKSDGWSFDLADYGYSNGYVMNPGDKSYRNNRSWKS